MGLDDLCSLVSFCFVWVISGFWWGLLFCLFCLVWCLVEFDCTFWGFCGCSLVSLGRRVALVVLVVFVFWVCFVVSLFGVFFPDLRF